MWKQLCDPMAERMVETMGGTISSAGCPRRRKAMAGPLIGMLKQMGGMMVGSQTGQALGTLAGEVVGSSDIGLPLPENGRAAAGRRGGVRPTASTSPPRRSGIYLALREAAHQRLFDARAVAARPADRRGRGVRQGHPVDVSALEEQLGRLDLTNPEAIQEALTGGAMLTPRGDRAAEGGARPAGDAARARRGLGDTVVDDAAAGKLPAASALAEAVRRRRATGGPAERTFATLVGLELRPRRLREAAALWRALDDARGIDGRDAVWAHPDLMPTAEDLDDPAAFVEGKGGDFDISTHSTEDDSRRRPSSRREEPRDVRVSAAERAPGPGAGDGLRADAFAVLDGVARAVRRGGGAARATSSRTCAAHEDGMWRECVPGHLTASAAVLDPEGERVLLTLHRKAGMWLPARRPLRARGHHAGRARRCGRPTEESGIEGLRLLPGPLRVDRHRVWCHGGSYHLDVQYAAVAPPGARGGSATSPTTCAGSRWTPSPTRPTRRPAPPGRPRPRFARTLCHAPVKSVAEAPGRDAGRDRGTDPGVSAIRACVEAGGSGARE